MTKAASQLAIAGQQPPEKVLQSNLQSKNSRNLVPKALTAPKTPPLKPMLPMPLARYTTQGLTLSSERKLRHIAQSPKGHMPSLGLTGPQDIYL